MASESMAYVSLSTVFAWLPRCSRPGHQRNTFRPGVYSPERRPMALPFSYATVSRRGVRSRVEFDGAM